MNTTRKYRFVVTEEVSDAEAGSRPVWVVRDAAHPNQPDYGVFDTPDEAEQARAVLSS